MFSVEAGDIKKLSTTLSTLSNEKMKAQKVSVVSCARSKMHSICDFKASASIGVVCTVLLYRRTFVIVQGKTNKKKGAKLAVSKNNDNLKSYDDFAEDFEDFI